MLCVGVCGCGCVGMYELVWVGGCVGVGWWIGVGGCEGEGG